MAATYYLLKYDVRTLSALTLVKFEAITDSGNCYLVSNVKDSYNREWVMYYDLYKMVEKNENSQRWYYEEKYDTIMKELISNL